MLLLIKNKNNNKIFFIIKGLFSTICLSGIFGKLENLSVVLFQTGNYGFSLQISSQIRV